MKNKSGAWFGSGAILGLLFLLSFGCADTLTQDRIDVEPAQVRGSIAGEVRDELTDSAVSEALINLLGAQATLVTDENGKFYLADLPVPGQYTLLIEKPGFAPRQETFSLGISSSVKKTILLARGISSPGQVEIGLVTKTSAVLSVKTPETPTFATLRYGYAGEPLVNTIAGSTQSTNHTFTLTGLAEKTRYSFLFEITRADYPLAKNETSLYSFTTDDGVAPVISKIQVKPRSHRALVNWTTSEDADAFLYWGVDKKTAQEKATRIATTTRGLNHVLEISGLKPETSYYYSVGSTDPNGNTTEEGQVRSFDTLALPVPKLIAVSNMTQTGAGIFWDLDLGASPSDFDFASWKIEAYDRDPVANSGLTPKYVQTLTDSTLREYRLENLAIGTNLWFLVKIVDQGGNEKSSRVLAATTLSTDVCWDVKPTPFELVPNPRGAYIRAGTLADGSDAKGYIVGLKGKMARFTNSKTCQFTEFPSITDLDLNAIAEDTAGDRCLAVGKSSIMVYVDNRVPMQIAPPGTAVDLFSVSYNQFGLFYVGGDHFIMEIATSSPYLILATSTAGLASGTWRGSTVLPGDREPWYVSSGGWNLGYDFSIPADSFLFDYPARFALNCISSGFESTPANWYIMAGGERTTIFKYSSSAAAFEKYRVDGLEDETIMAITSLSQDQGYAATNKGRILHFDASIDSIWRMISYYPGLVFRGIRFDPNTVNGYRMGIAIADGHVVFFRKQN